MTREEAIEIVKKLYNDSLFLKKDKEAMLTLVPELAENDDERIREEMIRYFTEMKKGGSASLPYDDCIAYLERQKEPENVSASTMIPFCWEVKQKEQKPILEVFGFKVGDAVRLKDGDGRKHIIKSFEEVAGVHGPNFYHVEFEDNSARDGIYPGEEYPNGYYTQMEKFEEERKPEWSEEDEDFINMLILHFNYLINKGGDSVETYKSYIEKLKSLRPQPKQEWSEEDKEMFDAFMHKLEVCDLLTNKEIMWAKLRLKSLRP